MRTNIVIDDSEATCATLSIALLPLINGHWWEKNRNKLILALLFGLGVFLQFGSARGEEFLAGYLVEKSLSVDNLFVFMAIFAWFKIPDALRHRVLYWGIIGAIVFRLIFVAIGTGLLAFGPKLSGNRFTEQDLVTLSALANQTAVALENARLVENLVRLNQLIDQADADALRFPRFEPRWPAEAK